MERVMSGARVLGGFARPRGMAEYSDRPGRQRVHGRSGKCLLYWTLEMRRTFSPAASGVSLLRAGCFAHEGQPLRQVPHANDCIDAVTHHVVQPPVAGSSF